MKTPEEIAREIVGKCFFEWAGCDPCGPDLGRPCIECGLALKIAAAISAERSAGTVPPAPKPAPACARCGGSGEIVAHASAVRNPGGGIERIVRRFEPCPECRGTP